jgi:hypothetical protein
VHHSILNQTASPSSGAFISVRPGIADICRMETPETHKSYGLDASSLGCRICAFFLALLARDLGLGHTRVHHQFLHIQ